MLESDHSSACLVSMVVNRGALKTVDLCLIPTLSLISCLTLAKLFYIFLAQFILLQNVVYGDPSNGGRFNELYM